MIGVALGVQIAAYVLNYSFRSAAAYKLAKRQNIGNLWLAFVPCACFFILGKLQDDGVKESRRKTWAYLAVIGSAVSLVFGLLGDVLLTYKVIGNLFSLVGTDTVVTGEAIGLSTTTNIGLQILDITAQIANLVFIIAAIGIYINIYKAYYPERAMAYSLIAVLVDVVFDTNLLYNIFLFTLRNKERKNFADYMRSRRPRYYYGYGAPFGSPYARGGDPYNMGGERREEPKKAEDPFEEFSQPDKDDPFFGDNERTSDKKDGEGGSAYGNNDPNDTEDDLFQ